MCVCVWFLGKVEIIWTLSALKTASVFLQVLEKHEFSFRVDILVSAAAFLVVVQFYFEAKKSSTTLNIANYWRLFRRISVRTNTFLNSAGSSWRVELCLFLELRLPSVRPCVLSYCNSRCVLLQILWRLGFKPSLPPRCCLAAAACTCGLVDGSSDPQSRDSDLRARRLLMEDRGCRLRHQALLHYGSVM